MKVNCTICKNRETCFNYKLGGLLIDTYCDKFQEEREISEEEQIILDSKFKQEHSVKTYKPIKIIIGAIIIIATVSCVLFIIFK